MHEALGGDIDILVDAWRVADIGNIAKVSDALRKCNVKWFEDPIALDNIGLWAEIREMAHLPIVAGETICTKHEFRPVLEARAANILNPDIACCGILEIKEIAAMAETYYVKTAIHNYNSMSIGLAASLQVAAVIPNFARVEFFPHFVAPSKLFSSHFLMLRRMAIYPLAMNLVWECLLMSLFCKVLSTVRGMLDIGPQKSKNIISLKRQSVRKALNSP